MKAAALILILFGTLSNASAETLRLLAAVDGGFSTIHPSANASSAKLGLEAGVTDNTKNFFGIYYSQHLNTASQMGATIRFCFPAPSRLVFVQISLDLVGLLYGAFSMAAGTPGNTSILNLAGFGVASGFQFAVGPMSILPYVSFDLFAYPYISSNYSRYWAPVAGTKVVFSFS